MLLQWFSFLPVDLETNVSFKYSQVYFIATLYLQEAQARNGKEPCGHTSEPHRKCKCNKSCVST